MANCGDPKIVAKSILILADHSDRTAILHCRTRGLLHLDESEVRALRADLNTLVEFWNEEDRLRRIPLEGLLPGAGIPVEVHPRRDISWGSPGRFTRYVLRCLGFR